MVTCWCDYWSDNDFNIRLFHVKKIQHTIKMKQNNFYKGEQGDTVLDIENRKVNVLMVGIVALGFTLFFLLIWLVFKKCV